MERGNYPVRVVAVRTEEEFSRIAPEWQALQERCPDTTPFQTWEWNATWVKHFRRRKRLRVLLFRREADNALCGIAPLYIDWHRGSPILSLKWLGTGVSDYLGLLALPDEIEAVTNAFYHYLSHSYKHWHIADLQQLPPISTLVCLPPPTHLKSRKVELETCPYLTLPETWEELLAPLGKKLRSNIGYYDRLLKRTFTEVDFLLSEKSHLEAGMNALFDLHQQRWHARWLPGVLGNPRVQAFHRELAHIFLERGWLRLHLLKLDGHIQSVLYCFAYHGKTYYYLGGFSPALHKFSIGTLLNARAIQHAVEEGHTVFDFLRGNEEYKYRWKPEVQSNQQILLTRAEFPARIAGQAGLAVHQVERYLEHKAKAFAAKQGRKKEKPPSDNGSTP